MDKYEDLADLLSKATPLPWFRANFNGVTVRQGDAYREISYSPYDSVLVTDTINALPELLSRISELQAFRGTVMSAPIREVRPFDISGVWLGGLIRSPECLVGKRVRLVPVVEGE